jgi:T4 gene Gp59 loader of gp41 DNA helicase/T4 gene Gp59 loader of gp41 DNA helicase C-term
MDGYGAYKKYVALKLHFQQKDYDYFKFSGSAKVSREKFESRNDKYFFHRIAKIYDEKQLECLLVANFILNKNVWIGDVVSETGRTAYLQYKKRHQSLEYSFTQDMEKIRSLVETGELDSFDALFTSEAEDNWPEIVALTLHQTIQLETFIIMNKVLNFMPRLNSKIEDTLVWPELHQLAKKYSPFITVDVKRFKEVMKKTFVQKSLVQNT